jgi:hypothetical protein
MPWARRREADLLSMRSRIEAESTNSDSMGNQFRSQVDGVARAVSQIIASNMTLIDVGPFSGTASGSGWIYIEKNVSFNLKSRVSNSMRLVINITAGPWPSGFFGGAQDLHVVINGKSSALIEAKRASTESLPPGTTNIGYSFTCSGPSFPGAVNTVKLQVGYESAYFNGSADIASCSILVVVSES